MVLLWLFKGSDFCEGFYRSDIWRYAFISDAIKIGLAKFSGVSLKRLMPLFFYGFCIEKGV